jgi:hypothetical protein
MKTKEHINQDQNRLYNLHIDITSRKDYISILDKTLYLTILNLISTIPLIHLSLILIFQLYIQSLFSPGIAKIPLYIEDLQSNPSLKSCFCLAQIPLLQLAKAHFGVFSASYNTGTDVLMIIPSHKCTSNYYSFLPS